MSRHGYNAVTITGPSSDRCSSCELLNLLHKPKVGQKRCKDCVLKENKRKMKMKHIPVHLRQRSLAEQTEKASRILAEEMEGRAEEAGTAGDDDHAYVSAARGPLLVSSSGRSAESEEQVKLSDILELTMELLELVETHVGRCGTLEDVARFENQLKVLRRGRDAAKSQGHVEDKRAIVLAFSIFSEHYTLTLRELGKLTAKNNALKQLAYDTAGLVKKSEAQFEAYVSELKQLQGAKYEQAHATKVELTRLRNETTALKLELNLRTNELREAQLDANAAQEQLRRERERAEEMRADKDKRITSLLAQLQQFSLDYSHEKGERLRLERENERLWNDRMAYRAEQIRGSQLSGAERAIALERDALEKREYLEWKKKAAARDIQAKERLRQEAWEVRQGIEADAYTALESIRKEIGHAEPLEPTQTQHISTVAGRTKEQRERERVQLRAERDRQERERDYWMELEQLPRSDPAGAGGIASAGSGLTRPSGSAAAAAPAAPVFPSNLSPISSPSSSAAHAQRWQERKSQLRHDEEVNAMIAELQAKNDELSARTIAAAQAAAAPNHGHGHGHAIHEREMPANDVIRSGNYTGGVESVLNNPRASPALPLFSNQHSSHAPAPVSYQPASIASSIPPPTHAYKQQQHHQQQQQQQQSHPTNGHGHGGGGGITEADRAAIRREVEAEMQAEAKRQQLQQQQQAPQSYEHRHAPESYTSTSSAAAPRSDSDYRRARSTTSTTTSVRASTDVPSVSVDLHAVEEGLRRSRKVRGESTRVYSSAHPLSGATSSEASSSVRNQQPQSQSQSQPASRRSTSTRNRGRVTVESESASEEERERERERDRDRERQRERERHTRSHNERKYSSSNTRRSTTRGNSDSRSPSRSDSQERSDRDRRAEREQLRARKHAARSSSSRHAAASGSGVEVRRQSDDSDEERHGRQRSRSSSCSRTRATFTVDGREAVPVRNFTLYSVKKTSDSA